MNLTITGPNAVKSDTGFAVSRSSRTELSYVEDGKTLVIEVEPGDGLAIYTQAIKNWASPHSGESISFEKKTDIIRNLESALICLGVEYIIC